MRKKLKVAVIQMAAGKDKSKNVAKALLLAKKAVRKGAEFIVLPETFNFRGHDVKTLEVAETIPGPTLFYFMDLARKAKVWILAGSIGEKIPHSRKVHNASVLLNPQGRVACVYRKIHLFEVKFPEKKILESKKVRRGTHPVLAKVKGIPVGLSVCYDLRFPELYHTYAKQGAQMLCVPSSFTYKTGRDHWEVLLKARAIENQCFVLAPNQYGMGSEGVKTFGHSLILDPWGRVLARAKGTGDAVLVKNLDFNLINTIRKNLPSLEEARRRS